MGTRPLVVVTAPSNLGLRPPARGGEPGTWRAPEALKLAGLLAALGVTTSVDLPRPRYRPGPEEGSGLLNAKAMRAFDLDLADVVAREISTKAVPIVIGGDCSILLGALAGVRRSRPVTLIHVDGHSDFRHPGNYDPAKTPGAAAGMDLALATGRGEAVMTEWPNIAGPLVHDRNVVQVGERESRDPDWAWPDVRQTGIERIDIFAVHDAGLEHALARINAVIDRERDWPFWIHLDVDVLDERFMPAVDSPGRPGLSPDELAWLLAGLVRRPEFAGMTVTVYDPDLDPDGRYACTIVSFLQRAFSNTRVAPSPPSA